MGNMDAYFMDPNGWAGRKLRVKKGEMVDIDYANLNTDPSQLILTGVW
jgi:FtsP/CotA-like multicopper oxidase with cupredoxin domain